MSLLAVGFAAHLARLLARPSACPISRRKSAGSLAQPAEFARRDLARSRGGVAPLLSAGAFVAALASLLLLPNGASASTPATTSVETYPRLNSAVAAS